MEKHTDLTCGQADQLLGCDFPTGELRWKKRPKEMFSTENRAHHPYADPQQHAADRWNSVWAGKLACGISARGRVMIRILGRKYYAHHVVWLLANGAWPERDIDHIDGDPTNNALSNLRLVDRFQQMANRSVPERALPRGVKRNTESRFYSARITVGRRTYQLGSFETPEEAHAAYLEAAERMHGEHAYHLSRKLKPK